MDLIYEKRETKNMPAKQEDFAEQKSCKFFFEKTIDPVYTDDQISNKIKSRRIRVKRKGQKRAGGKLLAAAALLLCTAVLDFKLLDGFLARTAVDISSKGLSNLVLREQSDTPQMPSERTIYTMEFAEQDYSFNVFETDGSTYIEQEDSAVKADSPHSEKATLDGVNYYPITEMDLSAQSVFAISNGTSFTPDVETISSAVPSVLSNVSITEEPLVLIIHTHAGECYTEYEKMYPEGDETRTYDDEKNVVRVGREIAETLSRFGICSIHSRVHHDEESFINAYSESAKTVKSYLEEYPSIKFVIDVHRDAIIRDDNESIKAVKNIAGENYAQLMFVVGTNELGHNHPDWQENLSLAMSIQKNIESTYPGLCRSINLRDVPFNQQLSKGYLLLEVGTNSNTLDEALLSARAFAQNFANTVYQASRK